MGAAWPDAQPQGEAARRAIVPLYHLASTPSTCSSLNTHARTHSPAHRVPRPPCRRKEGMRFDTRAATRPRSSSAPVPTPRRPPTRAAHPPAPPTQPVSPPGSPAPPPRHRRTHRAAQRLNGRRGSRAAPSARGARPPRLPEAARPGPSMPRWPPPRRTGATSCSSPVGVGCTRAPGVARRGCSRRLCATSTPCYSRARCPMHTRAASGRPFPQGLRGRARRPRTVDVSQPLCSVCRV